MLFAKTSILRLLWWSAALGLCLAANFLHAADPPAADAHHARLRQELDRAIATTGPALLKARSAVEVDPLLARFAELVIRAQRLRDSAVLREDSKKALSFVTRWQDYLHEIDRGQPKGQASVLADLLQQDISARFVGRPELLALAVQADPHPAIPFTGPPLPLDEQIAHAIRGIRNLADLAATLPVVDRIGAGENSHSRRVSGQLSRARYIARLQARLRDGAEPRKLLGEALDLARVRFYDGGAGESQDSHPELTARLRQEFIERLLPLVVGLDLPLPRREGETGQDYLGRAIAGAGERGDWESVATWAELRRRLAVGGPSEISSMRAFERPPFSFFLAGRNFERAGLPALAAQQYSLALRDRTLELPVELIEVRLRALEREHPAEYARGRRVVGTAPLPPVRSPATPAPSRTPAERAR